MDNQVMKILYLIPDFEEGGAEMHVLNLIKALSKRGHVITLATSGGRLEKELPEGVKVIHLPVGKKNPLTGISCAFKLARLDKKFQWNLLHAHSRVPTWIAWILSGLRKIKWLMTAHALYSLNAGIIPFKHADGVICVSEAVRTHLKNFLPENSIVIQNGIEAPKFFYKDFSHEGPKKLLAVGRLTRLKGLDVALRALSELKNFEWSFDILGEGPQREELENLSRSLGLKDRVKFHGNKNKIDVEKFMSGSSCLLFPSYQEGMGLVVLEALACGLPVIASDLEALKEISTGKLIPAGDIYKWKEAIKNFLTDSVACEFDPGKVKTIQDMAIATEKFYLIASTVYSL
ncbi:MAG: glycosyltransferase family 4 protein [Synergistaceae bacterium]|nr:glycosyltransferase family 4 protein [Synergistaceae bacterium]